MMRVFLLSAAFALFAVPALAYQSRCVEPYAPLVPDGRTATKSQIDSVRDEVKTFIKGSDQYQECLLLELKTEKQTAQRKGKTFDTNIEAALKKMIGANQRNKERVGAEYNGAAHAYNEVHPTSPEKLQERARAQQAHEVAAQQARKAQDAAAEQARKNQLAAEATAKAQKEARHRELAAKYGNEMADAIMAGEVRKGMTKEQVLAARGNPDKKEAIPPSDELWHYGSERIAITNGKVTFVGH